MIRKNYTTFKTLRRQWIEVLLSFACVLFILSAVFFNLPGITSLISHFDGRIYDRMVSLHWNNHQKNPKVVIIDIDERSVQTEGRWPWPRDTIANLLTTLKKDGVVTIGMDIVMSEAEINYATGLKKRLQKQLLQPGETEKQCLHFLDKISPEVDNDQIFIEALRDHAVVLGFLFHHESNIKKGALPPPLKDSAMLPINANALQVHEFEGYNGSLGAFTKVASGGFVTNLPDPDGTIRHSLLLAKGNKNLYPGLGLAVVMNYLLADNIELETHNNKLLGIKTGGLSIATNSEGQVLIPFWGSPESLEYYSATDVLQNKIPARALEGSIAIIGSTMTLLGDFHRAPIAQLFPGVEMVANVVQGILSQQLLAEYHWNTLKGGILLCLLGMFFAFCLPFLGLFGKFLALFMGFLAILALTVYLFVYKSIYLPPAFALSMILLQTLGNYVYSFIYERRQKRKISLLFGQYVPQEYVKELIESQEGLDMEGKTRDLTIQFIDIRDFTSVCEKLDANGVKRLLNIFFTPLTEIIFKHRGTIDKYVGDMIVAFWGAPIEDEEHACHAIKSSLHIFKQLPEINAGITAQGLPGVNIGLGLASGLVNVGDMGSEFRRAYTVLGDTVNLASRLQDLTKFYQVNILANDATRANQNDFVWRAVDRVTVKGRASASIIYEPLALLSAASPELLAELEQYNIASDYYYSQNWLYAEKEFIALSTQYPDCYLYKLYLERIHNFMESPPSADWDGVYVHKQK